MTSWQGKDGPAHIDKPERVGPGLYRITQPIHVDGTWKTTLRLHKGRQLAGCRSSCRRSRHPGARGAGRGPHDPLVRARPSPTAARAEEGRPRLAHFAAYLGVGGISLRWSSWSDSAWRGSSASAAAASRSPSAPAQARRGRAGKEARDPPRDGLMTLAVLIPSPTPATSWPTRRSSGCRSARCC